MEFGIFNAACVLPKYVEQHGESAEHDRIMDEVAFIVAADKAGFKYTWASEHHFLTEYSHLSASESFLAFVAAKTNNIHIGSGIFNITPPVNHPARIAERVAMLDHLSEGRFEFGTGRGSSTTEQRGFGIEDPDLTREMVAETLPQIVRMWKDEDYSYEGKFFSMPTRNVLPKPYSKPHPPIWMAAGQPVHLRPGRGAGRGRPVLRLLHPGPADPAGESLQGEDPGLHEPGRRLREQQRHDHDADDLHGGRGQGPQDLPRGRLQLPPEPGVPLPRHVPAARGHPRVARRSSPPWTPTTLDAAIARRCHRRRDPRRGRQGRRELRRDGRRPAGLRDAVDVHADRVVPGGRRDVRQARAEGLRQGPEHLTTKQRLAAGGK